MSFHFKLAMPSGPVELALKANVREAGNRLYIQTSGSGSAKGLRCCAMPWARPKLGARESPLFLVLHHWMRPWSNCETACSCG